MKPRGNAQRKSGDARGAVQSIERAIDLMRAVAASGREGRRLTDLAADAGLSKSTTHRILLALSEARLVEQDPVSRLFFSGVGLFLLGTASATRFSIVEIARPSLVHLAEEIGDTVFLSVPVDNDWVCVDRQVGPFPIRTLTVDVGDRGPLGVGSGGLALLAFRTDEDIEASIAANAERLASYRHFDPAGLRRFVATTRRQRYAFIDGLLVEGMSAVGVPLSDAQGRPVAALSVAAISSRLAAGKRRDIVAKMQEHVRRIEAQLTALGGAQLVTARARDPIWKRSA
jgi:DNA-binding IclR family transcriptional regulator